MPGRKSAPASKLRLANPPRGDHYAGEFRLGLAVSALVRTERLFRRSEAARGYLLISPTLAVLVFALAAPLALLVTYSFWTENGLMLDTNPTLSQYGAVVTREIYRVLFLRSLAISAVVTLATVALGYPMAYFLAFRVMRGKFLWLLVLSIPF